MAGILASTIVTKSTAGTGDFLLEAEWAPHKGCVLALCDAARTYGKSAVKRMQVEQAAIAHAISAFEPVTMLINPSQRKRAAELFSRKINLLEVVHHDVWARDTLPTIARTDSGQKVAVDWNFNVWGSKYRNYKRDVGLAERFAATQGLETRAASIVCEGGAIEVDGAGTLVTTETCLLNSNRNPGLSKSEVESALCAMTGAKKIIWIWGSKVDNITDGHIDGFMRFIRPGVVVAEITDDTMDPEYPEMKENLARLKSARDHQGNPFEIHIIKRPRWDVMPERGNYFAPSYVNSYFPNGGIVMPSFDDPERDRDARNLLQKLEPHRKITQIDVSEICEGGGGIHCNTMQIPL